MDGSIGFVGGEGVVEGCFPYVVHVDVLDSEEEEFFVHFSSPFVGCDEAFEGVFLLVDDFGDLCLDVCLERV